VKTAAAELARGALIVAVLISVHLAISAYYWIPDARLPTLLAPTGDVLALVLAVVAWSRLPSSERWPWAVPRAMVDRALAMFLTLSVLLVLVVAFGQGLLRREFGQDLYLVVDVQYVSSLVKLLFDNEPLPRFILWMVLVLAGIALAVAGPYRGLAKLQRHLAPSRPRQLALVAVTLAWFAGAALAAGVRRPVAVEAARQLAQVWHARESLRLTARTLEAEAAASHAPPAASHTPARHIYLVVVESYGQTLFSGNPAFATFADFLAAQGKTLAQAGYHARSRFMTSPVFGSGSWMPDASLLCGVRIDNQKRFAALFESDLTCLPKRLAAAGYRTVLAAANTEKHDPRFARTWSFNQEYFKNDFDYVGPRFGWSFIPDQFVLDFVHRHEVTAHPHEPLFVETILTSSHVPWNVVPPLVDWMQLGDGRIFEHQAATRFDNFLLSGGQYQAGYLTSIEYSLRVISEYLERLPADDDSLMIVLGDHQPRNPIADRFADPWWVPVHVLGRNARAVAELAPDGDGGFVEGLLPVAPSTPPPGLERLMPVLAQAAGAHTR
jgi:hypothetical protein